MAKSIRSKWKRKCRAVKRIRYGQKELERLKKTLGIDGTSKDIDMSSFVEVANVKKREESIKPNKEAIPSDSNIMEIDNAEKRRIFNPNTMRDQYGTYPVWMNQKRIRKHKKIEKKKKKSKRKQ